ncbi:MAG: hypothetical protein VB064_08265 [Oscillospiraceae bacterium]|nr:hypothetical protein [Oscillospiraceae bacterium]
MDTSTLRAAEDALLDALNASRVPPLIHLAVPLYRREFCASETQEGYIAMTLSKLGYRCYKAQPRKSPPPNADTDAIRDTLNNILPSRFHVMTVTDEGQNVRIILEDLS